MESRSRPRLSKQLQLILSGLLRDDDDLIYRVAEFTQALENSSFPVTP